MFLTCCEFDRKGYQTGTEPTGPNQVYDQAKYEDNLFFISLKQTKKGEAGRGGGGEDAGHLLPNDPEYEWMNNQRFPSFFMRLFYPKPELQETCDISDCTRHFSNQCGIYKTDW